MLKKKIDFTEDENGCFVVTSHRPTTQGYHAVRHKGIEYRMHRLVYQECFGEIPLDLVVRHKCDNRGCINPEHLELGTHQENMNDRDIRDRNAKGEKNGRCTITEEQVRKIKKLSLDGLGPNKISKILDISIYVVRKIRGSETWKHISA